MKTNNEIVEELFKSKKVKKFITNIAKQQREYYEDLESDLYLILLQTDNEKLNYLYENKQLDFYINRILCNQLKSTTSPFYRTYIKNGLVQDEITKKIEEEYEDK